MKKVVNWYKGLGKRGKSLALIGLAVTVIIIVELLK